MKIQSDARVDAYIEQAPAQTQERLKVLRKIIHRTFPTAIEDMSYKMPAYRLAPGKMPVLFFGAFEKHIGLYAVITPDKSSLYERISPYVTGKGTLRFNNDDKFPILLIEEVLAYHYIKLMSA